MRNRSRLGAVLWVCILLPSLVLACGSTPEPAPTVPAATSTPGAGPTAEVLPTLETPTQAPATQASPTQAP
ncbi:MAG: peptide ABC transporter substrate-binding protein, partial [Chloroflexi bacterium]